MRVYALLLLKTDSLLWLYFHVFRHKIGGTFFVGSSISDTDRVDSALNLLSI